MIVLGIDPGTERVGYGVVEKSGNALRLVAADLLLLDRGIPRLEAIKRGVDTLIKMHRPQFLSIEKLYFSTNQKTAMAVAEARGVILLAAAESGLSIRELDPSTVKAGITGYGRADKKAVAKMVNLMLGSNLHLVDDVTDALAIAIVTALREVAPHKK